MKIIDTSGNEITSEIDYTKGRLLQGDDIDTLVYTTWEESPQTDLEGNVIDMTKQKPTVESLSKTQKTLQDDINATQLALTEVYEMLLKGKE